MVTSVKTMPDAVGSVRVETRPEIDEAERQRALGSSMESVYHEMCHIAAKYLRSEGPEEWLSPEGLVNEAFIRLAKSDAAHPVDQGHLMALLCRQMRRILIEHGRQRAIEHQQLLLMGPVPMSSEVPDWTVGVLLERLASVDPRAAHVIELRVWGGFKHEEIARVLNVSKSTVVRDWEFGCTWLSANLPKVREP